MLRTSSSARPVLPPAAFRSPDAFDALVANRNAAAASARPLEAAFLDFCCQRYAESHAQLHQDLFVLFVLGQSGGVYCEFGAGDGVHLSNSYLLAGTPGWSGLLAEPARVRHAALRANRGDARIDQRCVFSESGLTLEFVETEDPDLSTLLQWRDTDMHAVARAGGTIYDVTTVSLNDLLGDHGLEALDYLSVDTEGSEYDILRTFDFRRFAPSVVTVEHNFTAARARLHALLAANGYRHVFPALTAFDDWYVSEPVWQALADRVGPEAANGERKLEA